MTSTDEAYRDFMLDGFERSPYERWADEQPVPAVDDYSVYDLRALDLAPWEELGGRGALVHLKGTSATNNAYVAEIAPGTNLAPQQRLCEEFIYVLAGTGASTVSYGTEEPHTVEWQSGSLFAVPLNAAVVHYNTSGVEPARFYAVTTLPLMLNLFHSREFVFRNPWRFTDRFDPAAADYFSADPVTHPGRVREVNFVPDVDVETLEDWSVRGAGGRNIFFEMAESTLCASISEFPVGTYKKAHRHGPGAHVIVLDGEGYTLMWRPGQEKVKVPWKRGTVFVPPDMWFHQHFNTGSVPARYMPIRWGSTKYHMFNYLGITTDVKEGGDQIEYEDEEPEIREMYEAELARNGIRSQM